jgi:hypothetical protein
VNQGPRAWHRSAKWVPLHLSHQRVFPNRSRPAHPDAASMGREGGAMRRPSGIVVVGLCLSVACSSSPTPDPAIDACSTPGVRRCNANLLQMCAPGMCLGEVCVGPFWMDLETCVAPKVCKTGSNPEINPYLQNGCYDADSSCAGQGATTCAMPTELQPGFPVDLWTCTRSAQDQSLQWSRTRCDLQTPSAICLPDWNWSGDPPPTACYELTGTCPPASRYQHRCEGTVLYFCQGPSIVDGKALLDWVPVFDCAVNGDVCADGNCVRP